MCTYMYHKFPILILQSIFRPIPCSLQLSSQKKVLVPSTTLRNSMMEYFVDIW